LEGFYLLSKIYLLQSSSVILVF